MRRRRWFSVILALAMLFVQASPSIYAEAASSTAWDGSVDVSWYNPDQSEYYISTPAQLAGLAALVNGRTDAACPSVKGDKDLIQYTKYDDVLLVGAGGGNVYDTVYVGKIDFSYKTVYLTEDLDMGGVYDASSGTWSGPNWTPIGGRFPMLVKEVKGDNLTVENYFNGVIDGQGHKITNLYCDRYAEKGFPYSQGIGLIGYLGGEFKKDAGDTVTKRFENGWQPTVRNLVVDSGSVLGRRMVAGVIGCTGMTNNGTLVEGCANRASIHSTDAKGVAGIVGNAGKGEIRTCYNTGSISTTYADPAGGIVGSNFGSNIYNCYNTGTIYTNGNKRGRGIGNHDSGAYTVGNCYFLAGCGDDPDNPGYYSGISKKITVSVTECTEAQLKSREILDKLNANGLVFAPDAAGINGGYPVLWHENGMAGGDCHLTLTQSAGGTISVSAGDTVQAGTAVTLSNTPDSGYILDHYIVNGTPIEADFFIVTGDTEISAQFIKLQVVTLTIPENPDCYVAVARQGWKLTDGSMEWVDSELLRSGDKLVQTNVLTVMTYGYEDAAPEDLDLEYIDAYSVTLPGTSKNANGTYNVNGREDVNVSITRSSRKKTWISTVDTDWYYSAGRTDEFVISTPEQLAGLAYLVNKESISFEGRTIRLAADISLANTDGTAGTRVWTPIGSNLMNAFKGTFDGRGHAIYDLTAYSDSSYAGLFGVCAGAEIRDLAVYGSVNGNARSSYAAGIAAYMSGGSIMNCENRAVINAAGTYAGGIAAMIRDGVKVENCANYGAVSGQSGLAGITGISDGDADCISGCVNFGDILSTGSSTYGVGGIAGRLAGTAERCANYGKVGGSDRYIGGIAGYTATKNASAITQSVNQGDISCDCSVKTAALGGAVGYAQYLICSDIANRGTVTAGYGFASEYKGDLFGREGTVKRNADTGAAAPSFAPQPEKTFPDKIKDKYTAVYMADGQTVGTAEYRPGDTSIPEPAVPEKEGCTGSWAHYELGTQDLIIRAIYRQQLTRDGDTISEDGTYAISWFSSGDLTIGKGAKVVLDGVNGGSKGFEGLRIHVEEGASLTLRNVVLNGDTTLLNFEGNNQLNLEGSSKIVSRAEGKGNEYPAVRADGNLTVGGEGSLLINSMEKNAAFAMVKENSVLTLNSGSLSIEKEELLGVDGGALFANTAHVVMNGGSLKIHTKSDNVSGISAKTMTVNGGTVIVQAEQSPAAIDAQVTGNGGSMNLYGHTGNSHDYVQAYYGRDAIRSFTGNTSFTGSLPFEDVSITDAWYDAVEYCYNNHYFNGTSETTFSPGNSMTRGMFVTVLYRLAGEPAVSGGNPFTDVPANVYYNAPVRWAVQSGITSGTSASTFSPDSPVTREQTAVFLYRYAVLMGDTLPRMAGADTSHGKISAWAEGEALWALTGGMFEGASGALADPSDFAPRSLLAMAVKNYDTHIVKGGAGFTGPLPFTDVSAADRYYTAVGYCYKNSLFNGTSATTFSPGSSMTRGMFVTVLYRLAGEPAVSGGNPFKDVPANMYYTKPVLWAVKNHITDGTSPNLFSPDSPVTKEQAAVFLKRYADVAGDRFPPNTGAALPHGALSPWAEEAVVWALDSGLLNGDENAMMTAGDYAPRSLLAVILTNYCGRRL
ncbi:MAG: S-layer homology domain-containing protein [Firmicutes bacterium]|nr:S-layer homology domain-containing protein [Bacillota bacterium]